MIDKLESLVRECKKASEAIKFFPGDIRILSHYDADGITSAAIIVKALQREGKGFHLTLIKQLSLEWIKKLAGEKAGLILFLDFGSGLLDAISEHLKGKQVIVLDHHQKQGTVVLEDREKQILHINPMDFRIEENISCSGVSYIVARAMNPENRELAELAIIGAIGDSQIGAIGPQWGVMGLNKEILKDAMLSKKIRLMKGLRLWGRYTRPVHKALEYSVEPYIPGISGSESASVQFLQELNINVKDEAGDWRTLANLSEEEQKRLATGIIAERIRGNQENPEWIFGDVYELLAKEGGFRDANEFATMLNATGKMGNGYLGIALCLNDPDSQKKVKTALNGYRKVLGSAISWIRTNKDYVKETERGKYVLAGKNISEHIISNAISTINRSYDTGKPIFGFVDSEEGVKVSARASDELVKKGINLKVILSEAAGHLGGQGGGHSGAAGATIPEGKEEEFISLVEGLLGGRGEEVKRRPESAGVGHSGEQARKEEVVSLPVQNGTRDRASLARDVSANDASRDADISASKAKEEMQILQGGKALGAEKDLNTTMTNKTINPESGSGVDYAERGQEDRAEGERDRGENKEEKGGQDQEDREEGGPGKKMEGEGLVRYIKS